LRDSFWEIRRDFGDCSWGILGNFNIVNRREERSGVSLEDVTRLTRQMSIFSGLLKEVEMEDLALLGRIFTWYHPNVSL